MTEELKKLISSGALNHLKPLRKEKPITNVSSEVNSNNKNQVNLNDNVESINPIETIQIKNNIFEGKLFFVDVIQVKIDKSDVYKEQIEKQGGKCIDKITSKIDFIIYYDGNDKTVDKALKYEKNLLNPMFIESCIKNNKIIPEDDFIVKKSYTEIFLINKQFKSNSINEINNKEKTNSIQNDNLLKELEEEEDKNFYKDKKNVNRITNYFSTRIRNKNDVLEEKVSKMQKGKNLSKNNSKKNDGKQLKLPNPNSKSTKRKIEMKNEAIKQINESFDFKKSGNYAENLLSPEKKPTKTLTELYMKYSKQNNDLLQSAKSLNKEIKKISEINDSYKKTLSKKLFSDYVLNKIGDKIDNSKLVFNLVPVAKRYSLINMTNKVDLKNKINDINEKRSNYYSSKNIDPFSKTHYVNFSKFRNKTESKDKSVSSIYKRKTSK